MIRVVALSARCSCAGCAANFRVRSSEIIGSTMTRCGNTQLSVGCADPRFLAHGGRSGLPRVCDARSQGGFLLHRRRVLRQLFKPLRRPLPLRPEDKTRALISRRSISPATCSPRSESSTSLAASSKKRCWETADTPAGSSVIGRVTAPPLPIVARHQSHACPGSTMSRRLRYRGPEKRKLRTVAVEMTTHGGIR
jgi:hypothetical protein